MNFRGRGTIREDQQASALNKRQDKRDALKTTVFPMECRHSYPHPVQTETCPHNVMMNGKDMQLMRSCPGETGTTPESNIPYEKEDMTTKLIL